jgi:hypothetical protein
MLRLVLFIIVFILGGIISVFSYKTYSSNKLIPVSSSIYSQNPELSVSPAITSILPIHPPGIPYLLLSDTCSGDECLIGSETNSFWP